MFLCKKLTYCPGHKTTVINWICTLIAAIAVIDDDDDILKDIYIPQKTVAFAIYTEPSGDLVYTEDIDLLICAVSVQKLVEITPSIFHLKKIGHKYTFQC